MKIAMTGGIACGKSLLSSFFNELGVETLDADDIVHRLIPADERRRLAETVFKNPIERRRLEARIHPLVCAEFDEWESGGDSPSAHSFRSKDAVARRQLRISVIPLLFEVHWDEKYDIILCVAASRENQIHRMMGTRGYTRDEAESRLAAQMPVEDKVRKSHYVITNDGSADDLRKQAVRFVEWLRKEQDKCLTK